LVTATLLTQLESPSNVLSHMPVVTFHRCTVLSKVHHMWQDTAPNHTPCGIIFPHDDSLSVNNRFHRLAERRCVDHVCPFMTSPRIGSLLLQTVLEQPAVYHA
jgi:hypothetical protein